MKKLLSQLIVIQLIFFNNIVFAQDFNCKQLLSFKSPSFQVPQINSVQRSGGKFLDTSNIRGLENVVFEWLKPNGMVTAKNGAFTCTNCGTLHKIDEVPDEPEIECINCAEPVVFNQKSQPPMVVIKNGGQIYVSEHNIVRDQKIVEYFEQDAVGCGSCGTIKLEPEENCPNCAQMDNVEIETPTVAELDWSSVKRNPKQIYPALIKMGLMDPVFARSQGYMTSRELFDVAKDWMSDGQIGLAGMIKKGLVDPKEAVQKQWITLTRRRFAMEDLLAEGFVSAFTAITMGWMEKGYAVEKGHITQSDADLLEVDMTPLEMFELAKSQVESGDITYAEAIKNELVDPKLSLEEGWIKLKDRREAVLELIDQGYILVEDALEKGWMVRDFAVNQGLIEAEVAAQLNIPVVQGRNLSIQANQRSEDFGEESPNIAPNAGEDNFVIPAFRQRTDQPFSAANISPEWRKVIKIGIASTVGLAITAGVLLHQHTPGTGPVAFGEVVGMHENLIVYDSQEVKDQYSGTRFNIETPPDGVRVITGDIGGQIKVSDVATEETEAIGQLMSVLVLEANDAEIKIYKQGSVEANFSGYEIGDELPIIPEGMFEFSIGE